MERISHREFRTWQAWKRDQWNNPSRTDYYLMQIAGCVKHVLSKRKWSIGSMKIPFKAAKQHKPSADEVTRQAKARWFARLGIGSSNKD